MENDHKTVEQLKLEYRQARRERYRAQAAVMYKTRELGSAETDLAVAKLEEECKKMDLQDGAY